MAISSSSASQNITRALEVVGGIFQEENIKICMKESAKGGLITGVSALVGGLLGGKTGLLAGGIVGTIAAYNMTQNYKSLLQVIHDDMDVEKQKKMFDAIQNVVTSIDITDAIKFVVLLSSNESIKKAVIYETINFIQNEMSMQISQN